MEDIDEVWEDRSFKAYAHFTDHPWRWVVGAIAVIVALSLVGNVLGVISVYWGAERAKLTAPGRVTQATYGTSNVLRNIAYFHDQCNTILVDEQNVRNGRVALQVDQTTLSAATDPIAQEHAGQAVEQDATNINGAIDQLSVDVRAYDAKSATQTANPFKAHNLPYRISINPQTGLLASSVNCN